MLATLVYVSSATELFREEELASLLRNSRRRNAERQVTGLLLYIGGNFMQALEGAEATLDTLYSQIERDPRHRLVRVILRMPIAERLFPDWSMAFEEASTLDTDIRAEISSFINDSNRAAEARVPSGDPPVLALLRRFAQTMR